MKKNSSYCWRSRAEARKIIRAGASWRVGDAATIKYVATTGSLDLECLTKWEIHNEKCLSLSKIRGGQESGGSSISIEVKFLWKALWRARLPEKVKICDNLRKKKIIMDEMCMFCDGENMTPEQ
ncbi:hypothetical protein DVH24_035843 [Malus domestica]|uniref:Reverse transcriptase zinc-binding domain-containing protein n=1 Tax=Malus domestica TaxID=3750 RepID=A0A498JPV9_MALDO|nr:hypothetical protein DVH24_035843 [Malus domestica]